MVDIRRRRKLALHLRQLATGLITNDNFENNVMDDVTYGWLPEQYYRSKEAKSDDAVILPMFELCWGLYDDTRRHKLKGRDKLNDSSLKYIARCILFLRSGRDYEWPYFTFVNPLLKMSFSELLLTVFTFGKYYRKKLSEKKEAFTEMQKLGDYEYWPFSKKNDYTEQLASPPFLCGKIV